MCRRILRTTLLRSPLLGSTLRRWYRLRDVILALYNLQLLLHEGGLIRHRSLRLMFQVWLLGLMTNSRDVDLTGMKGGGC